MNRHFETPKVRSFIIVIALSLYTDILIPFLFLSSHEAITQPMGWGLVRL